MAYELRVSKDKKEKPEVIMNFECAPLLPKMKVTELELSLMNL